MQGLGNDYVYLDCTKETWPDLPELARRMSRRHFGVGSDGLICILPSDAADFKMRIFNADGSEGEMCGNGIRCVGKYVYDHGLTRSLRLDVETLSGVKRLSLTTAGGAVSAVTVDMGRPSWQPPRDITVRGTTYTALPVSMGNPHAVVFADDLESLDLRAIGPGFETHPGFPGGVNAEFVRAVDPSHLRMRVWERGSGETLACGTGACAALTAAAVTGLCGRDAVVELPGGKLDLRWENDDHIYMTGPAVTVFEGDWPE